MKLRGPRASPSMALPVLPEELVEEILCHVPATNLKRLRSTCQWWDRLFDDKRFARKHSEKAPKQILPFMLTHDQCLCSVSVNLHGSIPSLKNKRQVSLVGGSHSDNSPFEFDVTRVFHCDGLFLCSSEYEPTIVVWNPLTNQLRWIQTEEINETRTFVLGYYYQDNGCKGYKILSFKRGVQGSEIYEFDSDSWKVSRDDIAPGWDINYSTQFAALKGDAYLFARDITKMHTGISLVRFDFSIEKFVCVPLPYDQCDSYKTVAISVVREEKLSVVLQREDASQTEVWVTSKIDDTTSVSWSKILALDLSPDLQMSSLGSFLLYEEKKVIVWCQKYEEVVEDENELDMNGYYSEVENEIINEIYIVGEDNKVAGEHWGIDTEDESCWPAIFNYVPSLDQIELAIEEEEEEA